MTIRGRGPRIVVSVASPPRDAELLAIVSARIRELLARTSTTKSLLGHDLRVPYKQVHNWERGNNLPSVPYVIRLAEYFGVTTDYLLGVSDDGRQRAARAASNADRGVETLDVLEAAEPRRQASGSSRAPTRKPRS